MGIASRIPEAGLGYVLYGDKSDIVSGYIANQLQALGPTNNPFMQQIQSALTTSYNYVTNTLIKSGIMQQLHQQGVLAIDNYFHELVTEEDFRTANVTMQRYVMAHEQIRMLYLAQNIDGYGDSYRNVFGKEVGRDDYNWRQVMDGAVIDGPEYMYWEVYDDPLLPGDKPLSPSDQFMIRDTWSNMDRLLAATQVDFTHQTDPSAKINRE